MASLCQCHGRSLAQLMRRPTGASEIDGTVRAGSAMDSVVPGVKRLTPQQDQKGINYNEGDKLLGSLLLRALRVPNGDRLYHELILRHRQSASL